MSRDMVALMVLTGVPIDVWERQPQADRVIATAWQMIEQMYGDGKANDERVVASG